MLRLFYEAKHQFKDLEVRSANPAFLDRLSSKGGFIYLTLRTDGVSSLRELADHV